MIGKYYFVVLIIFLVSLDLIIFFYLTLNFLGYIGFNFYMNNRRVIFY